jgi:hypothetical protein
MLRTKQLIATLLLGTFAVGLASGCMDLTTAPVVPQPVAVEASGRTAQSEGLIGSVIGLIGGVVRLLFRVLTIVGNVGGSLSNGRWRVDVPAGAFDGSADIKLGVATSTSPNCQLEISPADKNHFSTPVRLTADCSSIPSDQLKNYIIYWANPQTRSWDPVAGSTVDLNRKTVSAPLQHFSGYSVGPAGGKAGW